MIRRSSEPARLTSIDILDAELKKKLKKKRSSYEPYVRKQQPSITAVRKHIMLPLLHDFVYIYGITKPTSLKTYYPGKYPWHNTRYTSEKIQNMLRTKTIVRLGKLPVFTYTEEEVFSLNADKAAFFNYISDSSHDTRVNLAQIQKDVERGSLWMESHVPKLLKILYVEDETWAGKYPSYIQGMDRVVNAWNITDSVRTTVHGLRLLLLSIEFVYRNNDTINTINFLGRISPYETPEVGAHFIVPLFDTLNRIADHSLRPDTAYHIAMKLKEFYDNESNTNSSTNKLVRFLGKKTTQSTLRAFLTKLDADAGPMVMNTPDMIVAFRGR
jgi:hypothetical protein